MDQWARKGLRVLAFSYQKISKDQLSSINYQSSSNSSKINDNSLKMKKLKIENSQIFLGMVAIHDAPVPR